MAIVLQTKSGSDSMLHLDVQVDQPNTEFEVELTVRPKGVVHTFPPGYFDLIGSIDDETFIQHPQPPMPPAVEFE
jgi:hypothetical protein